MVGDGAAGGREDEYPHRELTRAIIAAAFEVHNQLGGGFLEKVYEKALVLELEARGLAVRAQAPIDVRYKDAIVGEYFADLFINEAVICEIKAGQAISPAHQAQLLNYLKATGMKLGLLINFSPSRVDVKRMVY
ncbi:MAG: GxxExxY protein [Dehalococcoidia bacterium]